MSINYLQDCTEHSKNMRPSWSKLLLKLSSIVEIGLEVGVIARFYSEFASILGVEEVVKYEALAGSSPAGLVAVVICLSETPGSRLSTPCMAFKKPLLMMGPQYCDWCCSS